MIFMSKNKLQDEIINDLTKDFPEIQDIEKKDDCLIIRADDDTLWNIFEILYKGLDDVELNMGKDDDSHIIIKTCQ